MVVIPPPLDYCGPITPLCTEPCAGTFCVLAWIFMCFVSNSLLYGLSSCKLDGLLALYPLGLQYCVLLQGAFGKGAKILSREKNLSYYFFLRRSFFTFEIILDVKDMRFLLGMRIDQRKSQTF